MRFAADLHVHSRYSRATSGEADLAGYHQWAQVKGIRLVGTGDFTHPGWLAELAAGLVEADGLFALKNPPAGSPLEGASPAGIPVRFMLTAEISSIYKKRGLTRKVHSLIGVPGIEDARRLSVKLAAIGNIASDGRPILGLDPKDLLDMLLETTAEGFLVPAHIWTPWFSLFGSKSGFDRIEDCFEELTPNIFALETGLSSDPPMNRRWSALDRFRLVSNSDAHSPPKLGREATLFDAELSYRGVLDALRTGAGFGGTLEFYPEEGKYHFDGHRKCGVSMDPGETTRAGGRCPVCGSSLTVGVLARVLELADRTAPVQPRPAEGFRSIIPLPELLAELVGTGPGSRGVAALYARVIAAFGSEYAFLLDVPIEDIEKSFGRLLAESVRRMRDGRVEPTPGFDGQFGVIKVFAVGELDRLRGQDELFASRGRARKRDTPGVPAAAPKKTGGQAPAARTEDLDPDQRAVLESLGGANLVFAGPGTGKTRILTRWIVRQVQTGAAAPGEILALTFTNRAAQEMRERLAELPALPIATFHSFCWSVLRERDFSLTTLFGRENREALLRILFPESSARAKALAERIEKRYEGMAHESDGLDEVLRLYEQELRRMGAADLSSLVAGLVEELGRDPALLESLRARYRVIAVDELQDINGPQYQLLCLLTGGGRASGVLCIGDPDQAIYGFRGSDRELFFRFQRESSARTFALTRNYRSAGAIVRGAAALVAAARSPGIPPLAAVKPFGASIGLFRARDPAEEGDFIAERIRDLVGGVDSVSVDAARSRGHGEGSGLSFSDIAVLFRTRAVRDALLPSLSRAGLPLTSRDSAPLTAERPFSYLVAAMRLIVNPADRVSAATLAEHLGDLDGLLAEREELLRLAATRGTEALIQSLLEGFIRFDGSDPAVSLGEEVIREAAREEGADLAQFLAHVSLCALESEGSHSAERVTLLTFHAAKGLEFPVVFIAGAEEGITPLPDDLEEERRLFYVAMTRAADRLFISHCQRRFVHGAGKDMRASRFLAEIPTDCILEEERGQKKDRRSGTRRPSNQFSLFC
jgi:DNA helicase-2/ATP-dependent DNA helicase PcrA